MNATVGQPVWFLDFDDRRGPFPAIVVRGGSAPLLAVFYPEGTSCAECAHWLTEDGTTTGWLVIPSDGEIPADLFV